MKINTDFGIQEIKPQKVFEWQGVKFAIIKRPEKYMGAPEPITVQRVVEYTTGQSLPVVIMRGCTLKQIEHKALSMLEQFETGENLKRRKKKTAKKMKTTDNKLIAEFMGMYKEDIVRIPTVNGVYYVNLTDEETFKFDTSWDWLIPVLARIKETERNGNTDYNHLMHTTVSMLVNNGLEVTYNHVVRFIEWYNSIQGVAGEKEMREEQY